MSELMVKKQSNFVFVPKDLDQAMNYANMIAKSSFCPKAFVGKPGDVLVAMQMGAEVGLSPMQALQNIAVINGRPSLWGDAALAVAMASPSYVFHNEWIEGNTKDGSLTAYCSVTRKGSDSYIQYFSMEQAKKAQLWGKVGPWSQYPERMLQMRARGFALRDKFADALRGLNIAEEVQDYVEVSVVGTQTSRIEHAKNHLNNLIAEKKVNPEVSILKIKIYNCLDINSLMAVGSLIASSSLSEDEKADLRSYYKKKQEILSANKETGEIEEIESSKTVESLISGKKDNVMDAFVELNLDPNFDPNKEMPEHSHIVSNEMYDRVKKQLLKSKSLDTLHLAADLIKECPIENHTELNEIYIKRQGEVK